MDSRVKAKVDRLSTAVSNIRSALIDKGVDATGHGAEDFATDIANMPPTFDPDDYAFVIYKENDEYKRRYEYIGKSVTRLDRLSSIVNNTSIISIILPSTITTLGIYCFDGCSNLKSINFENITTVYNAALRNCASLVEIIGPNITSFTGFEGTRPDIRTIIMPKLETINYGTFSNCQSLNYVDIRSAVIIGDNAFRYCSKLSNVLFSDNIESIGSNAFEETNVSGELYFPKLKSLGQFAFNFTKITKVKNLGQITVLLQSFRNCSKLSFIRIPQTVTEIYNLFYGFPPEVSFTIVCEPTTPPNYSNTDLNTAAAVYVPDASVDAYKAATGWSAIASKIHPLSEYTGSD